jgi:6-phosphogluconolactonase
MKMGRWARLLLAAAPLVAGCGDFWQAPSGGTTTTTSTCTAAPTPSTTITTPTSSSGNFYIASNISISQFQVVGYSIASGTLTPFTSPAALTGQAYAMAIDPNGHYLFVSSSGGIFLYSIGSGGALTLQNSSLAVVPDFGAYAIQVVSTLSGTWLLDASNASVTQSNLYAIPLNPSTFVPTSSLSSSPFETLAAGGSVSLGGMAVSANNSLVSVAEGSAGTQTFTFTAGNASPFGSVVYTTSPKDSAAISVAYSPQSSYLYIGETAVFTCSTNSGGLRILPITSGIPGSEPSASPYPSGGTSPHAILAANGYVYVANWQGASAGNVTGFLLVTSGPALTVQSNTVASGTEPYSMVKDSTGNFVLAVSSLGSPTFDAYTFDTTTTGQLDTAITTSSTGTGPVSIVAAP